MAIFLMLLILISATAAAPNINLPINSQVPPVARASKAFEFLFSESTFVSTSTTMTYALSNAPAWLQLDSPSRTLSGTPAPEDVGPFIVNLIASDETGSTSMSVTLIVSMDPGPGLGTPISNQLSTYGAFSSPDSLLLSHSSPLLLSFSSTTFTNTDQKTIYYALCANNTPLPSWINFDAKSLSFSGTTPQSTSPVELSQIIGIQLTASDVAGFSAAIVNFQLVIESHVFAFSSTLHTFNITEGSFFSFSGLQKDLTLDGKQVGSSDLAQIKANTPSWMSFDSRTLILSGTAPTSVFPQNVSVSANDIYGDTANTIVFIQAAGSMSSSLFNTSIGTLNATIGSDFQYSLNSTLSTKPDLLLAVDVGAASWLRFEPSSMVLEGHIPSDIKPQQFMINLTASQGSKSQSQIITLDLSNEESGANGAPSHSPEAGAAPTFTSKPKSTGVASPASAGSEMHKKVAAIVIPLVAILVGALLFVRCLRKGRQLRRARARGYINASKEKISYPTPCGHTDHDASMTQHVEFPRQRASNPPRIDLGFWPSGANKRLSRLRFSKATTEEATEKPKPDGWHEYFGDLEGIRPESETVPEFSLAPDETTRSKRKKLRYSLSMDPSETSEPSIVFGPSTMKRFSWGNKRGSNMSRTSSHLLSSNRISGIGHGHRGISQGNVSGSAGYGHIGFGHGNGGPPGFGKVRRSWQNTSALSWRTTESAFTIHTANSSSHHMGESELSHNGLASTMRSFPRPPTLTTLDPFTQPHTIHESCSDDRSRPASIRAVTSPSPTYPNLSPRQAFLKRRARDRNTPNPLFSAGPSFRASSHLQRHPTQKTSISPSKTLSPSKHRPANLKRSPNHRHRSSTTYSNNYPLSTRFNETFNRQISRFQSRSSIGSSKRYESADSEAQSEYEFYNGRDALELEEEVDAEGNKHWRHVDYPNPLATHGNDTPLAGGDGAEGIKNFKAIGKSQEDRQTRNISPTLLNPARFSRAQQLSRLSYLHAHGENAETRTSGEERMVIGGARGKRPVSVEQTGGGEGGMSWRGDIAFL